MIGTHKNLKVWFLSKNAITQICNNCIVENTLYNGIKF